jgi:cytolysin (calcineurin-like family phosphatase)
MKVFLKCAQAIGLAATTATLLFPAIPSQAQLTINNPIPPSTFNTTPKIQLPVTPQKPGLITFINKGAYVAEYQLRYDLHGKTQFFKVEYVPVGQKHSFTIPANALNIQTSGRHFVWMLVNGEYRSIFHQSFPKPPNHVCFTTVGLMGNAKVETSTQPTCHQ